MSATAAAFRARYLPQSPVEPNGSSPWLDSADGAELVRCPSRKAFRAWARRARIVPVHRGSRVLYAKRDVEAALVKSKARELALVGSR
jgi:hypothetical protein